MPLATDVDISVNKRPRFPKRCIVCTGREPNTKMVIGDFLVGWFSFFTNIPEGWGSVTVPVHAECKRPFKLRRWLTRICYIVFFAVIWTYFGDQIEALFPPIIRNPGRKVAAVIILSPLILIDVFYPPRFDISVSKYYVTFLFIDKDFAAAFAKKNDELRRYREIVCEM
jgi:hypothetical protein